MTTTHPHPELIDPRPWCAACHTHAANGTLCPVCLDDRDHGAPIITGPPEPLDGRGNN